jgi:hypothetical protein
MLASPVAQSTARTAQADLEAGQDAGSSGKAADAGARVISFVISRRAAVAAARWRNPRLWNTPQLRRGVAQPGSAHRSGR